MPPQVKALGSHPSSVLRSPAELPSGLFNLGATCYLNTQLQVLYHCLEFRSAIYAWSSPTSPAAAPAADGPPGSVLKTTAMRHAQLRAMQQLFATMQLSAQRCASTAPFAAVYNLASGVQQDVQEFFKLFVTHVEESLASSADPCIKHILQRQFRGQASWVNNCLTCDYSSLNSEAFYELQVQTSGLHNLHESLHDFCEMVSLSGSSQHARPQGDQKPHALRFQRIDSLPPVLHIQLSRYGYDFATGQKKKHHDAMHVPDIINMSHVEEAMREKRAQVAAEGGAAGASTPPAAQSASTTPGSHTPDTAPTASTPPKLYELCAVLYHHGRTANYGHYTCDVWDDERAGWFHFDDAMVTRLTPAVAQPDAPAAATAAGSAGPSTAPAPAGKRAVGGQKRVRSSTKNTVKNKSNSSGRSATGSEHNLGGDVVEVDPGGETGGCFADTVGRAAFNATSATTSGARGAAVGAAPALGQWCNGCVPDADTCVEPAVTAAQSGKVETATTPDSEGTDFASRAEALAQEGPARGGAAAGGRAHAAYVSAASTVYPAAGDRCSAGEYADWCRRRRHPGMSSASGSGTRTAYMLVYKRVHMQRAARWHAMQCAVGAGQVSQADIAAHAAAEAATRSTAAAVPAAAHMSQDSLTFSPSTSSVASGPSVAFDSQELLSGAGSNGSFLSPRPPRHSPAPPTSSAVKRACATAAVRARELLREEGETLPQPAPLAAASLQHLQAPPMQSDSTDTTPVASQRRATRSRGRAASQSYAESSDSDGAEAGSAACGTRRSGNLRSMLLGMADKAPLRKRSGSAAIQEAACPAGGSQSAPKRRRGGGTQRTVHSAHASQASDTDISCDEGGVAAAPSTDIALPLPPGDSSSPGRVYAVDVLPPPPSGPYQPLEHDAEPADDVQEVTPPGPAKRRARKGGSQQQQQQQPPPAARAMALLPPLELCSSVAAWNRHLARRAAQWVTAAHRAWALALARRALYMVVFAGDAVNPHASCSAVTVSTVRKAAQARSPQWYWVPTAWLRAWIAGETQPPTDDAEADAVQDCDPSVAAKEPSPRAAAMSLIGATGGSSAAATSQADDDDVVALDESDQEGGGASPDAHATSPTAAQAEELRQRLASLLEDSTRQRFSPQDRLAAPGFALFAPLAPPRGGSDNEPGDETQDQPAVSDPVLGGFSEASDTPPAEMHVGQLLTAAHTFATAVAAPAARATGTARPALPTAVMLPFAVPRAKRLLAPAYNALTNAGGAAAREHLGDAKLLQLGALAWKKLAAWAHGDASHLLDDVHEMKKQAMKAGGGAHGGEHPPSMEAAAQQVADSQPLSQNRPTGELDWVQDSWLTRPVLTPHILHDGNFISPDALQMWVDTLSASRSNHSDAAQLIALLGEPEAPVPAAAALCAARDAWVTACLQGLRSPAGRARGSSAAHGAVKALRSHGVDAQHMFPLASDFEPEHVDEFRLPDGQCVTIPPVAADDLGGMGAGDSDRDSTTMVGDDETPQLADVEDEHGGDGGDASSGSAGDSPADTGGREAGHLALMRALSQAASLWVVKDSEEDVFLVSRAFVRALKARSESARKAHAAATKAQGKGRRPAGGGGGSASFLSSFLGDGAGAAGSTAAGDGDIMSAPNADLVGPRGFVTDQLSRRSVLYVRRGVWEALQGGYPRAVPVHLLAARTDPWMTLRATHARRAQEQTMEQRRQETSTPHLKALAKRSSAYRSVRHGTIGTSPLPPGSYALVPHRYLARWREFINGSAETHDLESLSWGRFAVQSSEPGGRDGEEEWTLTLPTHVLAFLCRVAPVQLPPAEGAPADSLRLAYTAASSPHATEQDVMAATGSVEDFDVVPLDEWQDMLRAHPELRGPDALAPPRSGADGPFRSLVEEDPTPAKSKRGRKRSRVEGGGAPPLGGRKAARTTDGTGRSTEVDGDDSDAAGDTSFISDAPRSGSHDEPHQAQSSSSVGGSDAPHDIAALDAVAEGALHPRDSAAYRAYCSGLVAPILRVLPCTKTPLLPAHIVSAPSTFGQPCPNLPAPDSCVWWTDPPLDVGQLRQQLSAAHAATLDFTGRIVYIKQLPQGELPPGVVPAAGDAAAQGAGDATEGDDITLVDEGSAAAPGSDDDDFVPAAGGAESGAGPAACVPSPAPRSARARRRGGAARGLLEVSVNSADTPPEVLIKCFQAHDVGLGARLWHQGAPLHAELSLAQAGVSAGSTLYMELCADGAVDLAAALSAAGGAAAGPEAGFSGSAFLA